MCGRICPNVIQDIMYVLVTYKFKKDRISSNREKGETLIFRRSRTANSIVRSRIWIRIQAFMHVHIQVFKRIVSKQPRTSGDTVFPIMFVFQMLKGSLLRSLLSDLTEVKKSKRPGTDAIRTKGPPSESKMENNQNYNK